MAYAIARAMSCQLVVSVKSLTLKITLVVSVALFAPALVSVMMLAREGIPMQSNASRMRSFFNRWQDVASRLAAIPIVFFGVGIYRAWLAIFFRYDAFPTISGFDYFLFEGSIGVVSLLLALLSSRITPLWSNKGMCGATAVAMVGGSVLLVIACFYLQSEVLKLVGLVCAGAGLASLILMWAEFYGSLNPMRVAIYHALAIFIGECIKWLFAGLSAPYLMFFAIVLPVVSLVQVRSSMRHLPSHELPHAVNRDIGRIFPWKPILLMSVCTFAGGYSMLPAQTLLAGNIAGGMAVTALVFLGALSTARWFNFDTVYQLAFPFFIVGFLLISSSFALSDQLMAFCYDAGYTMLSMFIMLIMSNITYRFGISAVWINGIERGIRYIVELLGWAMGAWVTAQASPQMAGALFPAITVAMMVIFVVVFYSERNLSSKWGITMDDLGEGAQARAGRLAMRVSDLSQQHDLTPREEEVLQLIARGKTPVDMERELFVAGGTVKAHINHIYRKFGIHSRQELFDLLSIDGRPFGQEQADAIPPATALRL